MLDEIGVDIASQVDCWLRIVEPSVVFLIFSLQAGLFIIVFYFGSYLQLQKVELHRRKLKMLPPLGMSKLLLYYVRRRYLIHLCWIVWLYLSSYVSSAFPYQTVRVNSQLYRHSILTFLLFSDYTRVASDHDGYVLLCPSVDYEHYIDACTEPI